MVNMSVSECFYSSNSIILVANYSLIIILGVGEGIHFCERPSIPLVRLEHCYQIWVFLAVGLWSSYSSSLSLIFFLIAL